MRRTNDIIGQILIIGFFIVAAITPLAILVFSTLNFVRNSPRRLAIVLKAMAALVIWVCLTFIVLMVFMMMAFSYANPTGSPTHDLIFNGVFALEGLIYFLIGLALVYWMKRQAKKPSVV